MATASIDNKKAAIVAYNYTAQATLITDDGEEDLITGSITDILLNYEYEIKNMPTIYIGIRINTKLYNKLLNNKDKAMINLVIEKYNKNSDTALYQPYIRDNFVYDMTKDTNYNQTLENLASNGTDTTGKDYKVGYIALIKIESLNDNKIINNCIVKNTNMSTMIYTFTKHMNMVMEPIKNNINIDQLVIPPMDSITKLLKYIDLNYAIYDSGYRYFRDFNKTYLLSYDGNPVPDGSTYMNTIIIKIMDNVDADGKLNSTQVDIENNAYVISLDSDRITIDVDDTRDMRYNKIIGVTSTGKASSYDLDIIKNRYSTEKVKIQRVNNENTRSIVSYKNSIEKHSVILHIIKTEIDGSMITPNKEFIVKNTDENKKYNGRYILIYKKEILLAQDNTFTGAMAFGLTKID